MRTLEDNKERLKALQDDRAEWIGVQRKISVHIASVNIEIGIIQSQVAEQQARISRK